jgi:hypothetical protein
MPLRSAQTITFVNILSSLKHTLLLLRRKTTSPLNNPS